ncbi:hypothetical protein [Sphingobacterium cellulitidis]|uniref:hypothetical protein n=1 Tax=Sphingobacterium cellulitidis TaxID=1768011 RepID=UPI000B93F1A0|nr:hypothetical protein CHT99_03510 [Sphingobacterium cellulitidis]
MYNRELQVGHPFLNLTESNKEEYVSHNLTCQIRTNPKSQDKLISDAIFCSQKLLEFALELDGNASVDHSFILSYRNGKLTSSLKGYFGKQIAEFNGVAKFEDVKPYIDNYMKEVSDRRKQLGK